MSVAFHLNAMGLKICSYVSQSDNVVKVKGNTGRGIESNMWYISCMSGEDALAAPEAVVLAGKKSGGIVMPGEKRIPAPRIRVSGILSQH